MSQRLRRWLRKTATVFSVYMQDNLTYRGQAVIWMMTDTIPAIIMPLIWLASFQGRPTIGGLTPSAMVTYYLTMLCLKNVMITHIMWDMSLEIREGRFSIFLTRPYSYMSFQYAGNLSWRLMRLGLFIPILGACVLLFRGTLRWEDYYAGWSFWLAVVAGHGLSFFIGFAMGLLALFFTEVRSIYMFYYMPFTFLSGELVPVSLLPEWAEAAARVLPFRYTLSFAADIFLGRLSPVQVQSGFMMLFGWLILTFCVCQVMWRKGLRHYTAVGM